MSERLRRAAEESRLVAIARRRLAFVRSILRIAAKPFAPVLRRMNEFDRAVDRAVAARNADDAAREQRVREVLAESRLVQFVDRVFSIPAAAWPSSALARRVLPVARDVQALDRPQQIRLAGIMLAVGLAARVVSYFVMGGTAGWVTALVWSAVMGIAILLVVWNRQIAAAWDERRRRPRS